jgi:hypothetical protein
MDILEFAMCAMFLLFQDSKVVEFDHAVTKICALKRNWLEAAVDRYNVRTFVFD